MGKKIQTQTDENQGEGFQICNYGARHNFYQVAASGQANKEPSVEGARIQRRFRAVTESKGSHRFQALTQSSNNQDNVLLAGRDRGSDQSVDSASEAPRGAVGSICDRTKAIRCIERGVAFPTSEHWEASSGKDLTPGCTVRGV